MTIAATGNGTERLEKAIRIQGERWAQVCRLMALCIADKRFKSAHNHLDCYITEMESADNVQLDDHPSQLAYIGVSPEIVEPICAKFDTIREVAECSKSKLTEISNLSHHRVLQLRKALLDAGLDRWSHH